LLDVVQVSPGSVLRRSREGEITTISWAGSPFLTRGPRPPVAIEELDEALARAVRRQLRADVEVGVFLSGGLDSALVLSYAVATGARPVALTVRFPGHGDYDESGAAAALATRLGVRHEVAELNLDFAATIEEIGMAYDMPFGDPSAIASLPLARLARRHVIVALSGTGADDLFAGYRRHRAHLIPPAPRLLRPAVAALARVDAGRGGERGTRLALARSYAIRMAQASSADPLASYLKIVGSSTSAAGLAAVRFGPDVIHARAGVAIRHGLGSVALPRLDQIQDFELRTYLPGDLLQKEDRATMAHGVEGRLPLLDDELVRLAGRVPPHERAGLRGGKLPLRELGRRRIPLARHGARKQGFAVPLAALFAGPWRDGARDWLRSSSSELVDVERAAAYVGATSAPALDVWALCALCAWERRLKHLTELPPASVVGAA
jgi:asparagine synthase (glutamine-hydrolysing)